MANKSLLSILISLFVSSVALGQDYGITHVNQPYESLPAETSLALSPPQPLSINNITDTLLDQVAGHFTSHQVGFQLPGYIFPPPGCLAGRQVVITFPSEFDVSTVTSVTYRDSDSLTVDPRISWVYIYSHSIVIRLSNRFPGPGHSQYAYLTLNGIKNPTVARDYQITLEIGNSNRTVVAGPNFSSPFYILPDVPRTIALTPDSDLTLTAGEGVQFQADVVDQYGNVVPDMTLDWRLDPQLDPIGKLYGAFLQTTTAGKGRVLVSSGSLSKASGLIVVTPAPATGMTISSDPDTTQAGSGLTKDIEITIIDSLGNRVTGYRGAIWFTSDDPSAEIRHNEANPYEFTEADQGRKVFSGSEFVFRKSGRRTLTAQSQAFSVTKSNLFVLPSGISDFTVIYPAVRAGETFDLQIQNAIDSFGNRFNGTFSVGGGTVAPDGSPPILTNLVIQGGEGSAQEVLVATGINELTIGYGSGQMRQVTIPVLPGVLSALAVDIDETQFIGHPFMGKAEVTAFDRFRNVKTDYAGTGTPLRLFADSGSIDSEIINPDAFLNGVATITDRSYVGYPGRVAVHVAPVQTGSTIEASVEILANGIAATIAAPTGIPSEIPQGWDFVVRGSAVNPGNLTPIRVTYGSGFALKEKAAQSEFAAGCIPQPFYGTVCSFGIDRIADADPGTYNFGIIVDAIYLSGNDTIATRWTYARSVQILPFIDFAFGTDSLPDTAYAMSYIVPATVTIHNANSYNVNGVLKAMLGMSSDTLTYNLGSGSSSSFDWPTTFNLPIKCRFDSGMPAQTYTYFLIVTFYQTTNSGQTIGFSKRFVLPQTVAILSPDTFAIDSLSFSPKLLPANGSIPLIFNISVNGSAAVVLDGTNSTLTLSSGSVTSAAALAQDSIVLKPGINQIATTPLFVPSSWEGKQISGRLHLTGIEAGAFPIDVSLDFGLSVTVTSSLSLQIVSLTNDALNSPRVNTRQPFTLTGKIANLSVLTIAGPITMKLVSDGGSVLPPLTVVDSIPPHDTIPIVFPVVADSVQRAVEVFSLQFIGDIANVTILPPVDNEATAIIQVPAKLDLAGEIVSPLGSGPIVGYGDKFKVEVRLANQGQSAIRGGTVALDYSGSGDFGVTFPIAMPLDTLMTWNLTAPQSDLSGSFSVRWAESPIDQNTGKAVDSLTGPITIPFTVQQSETKLVMQADQYTTKPLQRGVSATLLQLSLENVTNDNRAAVQLSSIAIELTDRDGNRIQGDSLVAAEGTNFYVNDEAVATVSFVDGLLSYRFAATIISPGEIKNLELRLAPRQTTTLNYFNMRVTGDRVIAWIAQGTQSQIPVTGLLDRPFEINVPKGIIAEDLGASFKNYPNPFNPISEQTEFRYYLSAASDVDIYIFTATGEQVRHMHFNAGSTGGQAGPNVDIYWDGKNENGQVVLNGAYLALIKVADGGRTAKVKVAVVK